MELFDNFEKNKLNNAPLADKIRPERLEDFLGQEKIVGPGKPLRKAIEEDKLQSIILWGPPGSGKTTLARIIAKITKTHFVPFSAAVSGVPALRKIIKEAQDRRRYYNQKTILFVDEIHRFNKAQHYLRKT
ncbi:Replication-associated recombination protein A [subsurface metagenome]